MAYFASEDAASHPPTQPRVSHETLLKSTASWTISQSISDAVKAVVGALGIGSKEGRGRGSSTGSGSSTDSSDSAEPSSAGGLATARDAAAAAAAPVVADGAVAARAGGAGLATGAAGSAGAGAGEAVSGDLDELPPAPRLTCTQREPSELFELEAPASDAAQSTGAPPVLRLRSASAEVAKPWLSMRRRRQSAQPAPAPAQPQPQPQPQPQQPQQPPPQQQPQLQPQQPKPQQAQQALQQKHLQHWQPVQNGFLTSRRLQLPALRHVQDCRGSWCGPTKESNWVIPGKLLVGAYPLTWTMQCDRVVIHTRDLRKIMQSGVNTFVCLQDEFKWMSAAEEAREHPVLQQSRDRKAVRRSRYSIEHGGDKAVIYPYIHDAAGMLEESVGERWKELLRFFHLPIVDLNCVEDAPVLALAEVLAKTMACERGANSEAVTYLHCWGGHGRTGTLVAIILALLYGVGAAEALDRTQVYHDVRKCKLKVRSPQTDKQCEQVVRIIRSEAFLAVRDELAQPMLDPFRRSEFEIDVHSGTAPAAAAAVAVSAATAAEAAAAGAPHATGPSTPEQDDVDEDLDGEEDDAQQTHGAEGFTESASDEEPSETQRVELDSDQHDEAAFFHQHEQQEEEEEVLEEEEGEEEEEKEEDDDDGDAEEEEDEEGEEKAEGQGQGQGGSGASKSAAHKLRGKDRIDTEADKFFAAGSRSSFRLDKISASRQPERPYGAPKKGHLGPSPREKIAGYKAALPF
jgi:hypothetical protein